MGASNRTNRQERILDIVRQNTLEMLNDHASDPQWIHAASISEILGLDRANVARELNNLYRDGELIKLQGKPTLYICREALAKQYPGVFFPSTLPKGSRLGDYTTSKSPDFPAASTKTRSELETQIGANGSMKSAVLYAKAAVMYPGNGLHTLITGGVGVGKSQLVRKMYNHAVIKGAMPADAPFITVNCRDHTASPRLLLNQLFGYSRDAAPKGEKSRRGLVERASGGILCLDGIDRLPSDVHDSLITLLEKNTYTRVGEPSIIRKANVMIVAISSDSAQSQNLQSLSLRFPVQIPIPDLKDRTISELAEILMDTFYEECVSTGLSFRITKEVFSCFLKAAYPGNLGELNSSVRTSCSLVYLEHAAAATKPRIMEIGFRHLPPDMLQTIHEDIRKDQLVREFLDSIDFSYILFTPTGFSTDRHVKEQLLDIIHGSRQKNLTDSTTPVPLVIATEYQRYFLNANHHLHAEYPAAIFDLIPESLISMVRQCLEKDVTFSSLLAQPRDLYHFTALLYDSIQGQIEPMPNAARIATSLQSLCNAEMRVIEALQQRLADRQLPSLSDTAICCLVACINHGCLQHSKEHIPVILVCHGHDIAVNLAEYVNHALGSPVVHSLNYQDGMGLDRLLERSEELVRQVDQGNGVLFMVDMPPLTELHEQISNSTGIRCESISGVNLPMLLSVGHRIVSEEVTLDELANDIRDTASGTKARKEVTLQDRIYNEILSPALTFLNPQKAVDVLGITLTSLLQELHLPWSTEIATKFIIHCSHMLERLILGDPLRYDKLKAFVNQNASLMNELERQMEYPAEVFGVSIPASELAYVAEIFIPYLN